MLGNAWRALVFLSFTAAMVIFPPRARGQDPTGAADRWNRAALEWIGLLREGSFEEAGARVDPEVPEGVMGPEELETLWAQISTQLGALQSVDAGMVSEQGPYHLVDLPSAFQTQNLTLRVVLTDALQVSGFFLRPSEPAPYAPPVYVEEESFREVEVKVGADPWVLPGTLTLPRADGPFPAVVLVHGSGPNDRDEMIGGNRPFRDLAWGLASRGIAVLRYDKRTKVYGATMSGDIGLDEEVILDALAAVALVRDRDEIDPDQVFLLGHSLGGMLAPEIARRDGRLAGVVVLAAPARPFFEVLRSQLQYLAGLEGDPDSPARVQLDSLIDLVGTVETGTAPDDGNVLGAPPPYWREVAAVDPVETALGLSTPLFILQGGRDYQSTTEDLQIWKEALAGRGGVSLKLYPALNHLFMPGTGKATPEEYATVQSHVAQEVVQDLAEWIRGIRGTALAPPTTVGEVVPPMNGEPDGD